MYVGNRYTVQATTRVESDFRCSGCGYEADVIVLGVGSGEGRSPYMLDNEGAKQRARAAAEEAARKNAWTVLAIAPCPKCNERDPKATREYKNKTTSNMIIGV